VQPIFVGDVQGCGAELDELLVRAEARFGADFELWLVGDLVNRGPNNLDLLQRVRERVERGRCRYILGNHEIALLRSALGLREPHPLDTFDDVLDDPQLHDWIEWLRRRPLVECGEIGGRPFAMVHAAVGVDWGLDEVKARARGVEAWLGADDADRAEALLRADRDDHPHADDLALFTRCRSVGRDGRWSSRDPSRPEELWHHRWAKRGHDYGVVYGHFAIQGLHVAPRLRGLDTGCVHQGCLTAWLPDPGRDDPFDLPDDGFWQADARRRYYDARGPIRP
jgi:bis(5'-nucleosyl)-tetraphosphatase (symmetrical)